jgi:hypothetical protein
MVQGRPKDAYLIHTHHARIPSGVILHAGLPLPAKVMQLTSRPRYNRRNGQEIYVSGAELRSGSKTSSRPSRTGSDAAHNEER